MSLDKSNFQASGFTLIEVLIALLVFWLGMLGIALYTASGLRTTATNQVRSTAVKAASIALEPLTYHTRADCLSTMLTKFPLTVTEDNRKDSYVLSLVNAIDGSGATIASGTPSATTISVASGNWVSPVTITMRVPYAGLNGAVVTATPTYTIVLQNYTVGCDA